MPTLSCVCGRVINLSAIPCPDGYLLVPEEAWDRIVGRSPAGDEIVADLMAACVETYLCPRCGRLLIFFDSNRPDMPDFYVPEPG